jgi:hypothetical protein
MYGPTIYVEISLDLLDFEEQLLIKYYVTYYTLTTFVSNYTHHVVFQSSLRNVNQYR